MTWIRALVAAGLSVLMPGAGHVLIRDWIRALLFAGLFISASVIFLPTEQVSAAGSMGEAMDVAVDGLDTWSQAVLSTIVLLAAIDAAIRAMNVPTGRSDEESAPTCPACGRELDDDLAFCHWCTTRLEPEPADDQPPEQAESEAERVPDGP